MTRSHAFLALLVALAPFYMGADTACVSEPSSDGLVGTDTVRVAGVLMDEDGNTVDGRVQLRVNGVPLPPVSTISGQFVFSNVPLAVGPNVVDGVSLRQAGAVEIEGQLRPFRIQRKNDLFDRGTQPYFLDFRSAAYQQQVRDMLSLTLNTPLSAARLEALLAQVNDRVRERFRDSYERRGLRVVLVDAPGPGISNVFFDGVDADAPFGRAPLDYRNRNKQQTGTVFVASLRRAFVDNNLFFLATPARPTDTPERRALDIGNLLSKAGIHELGHTLGLVTEGPQFLDGCDGQHNCGPFDDDNPLANRFMAGVFFMDARRSAAADFGSASATMRVEALPVFNNFNFGYLDVIH